MKKRPIKQQWYDSESETIDGQLRAKKPPVATDDGSEDWQMNGLNHGEIKINELPQDPTIFILDRNGRVIQFKPGGDIEFLTDYFIRKDIKDKAHKLITFEEGIMVINLAALDRATIKDYLSSEKFISGLTGEGMKIWKDALGKWNGEIDNLTVREIFSVFELLIQKNRSINGALTVSNGDGKIKSVTETDTHYLLEMEGDLTLMPDDFIRCQTWGTGEVEEYKFDFTDSSKWRTNLFDAPWLVSEYTNNLYRVNSISNSEESYFLLGYDLNGGESIDISLKISGLEEGDRLVVATGSTNNQIAQEITSVGTYTFNYLNDNNDGRIDTFVIIYQATSVGTKNLLIEQVPEKKIETVTNKFYWVKVDGIEEGKVKVLKSEFDNGNQQPVAYPYDFTDSSKWQVPTTTGDITIDYTNHSCRFTGVTLKDATYILFFYNKLKPGESINISLKITGLGEGGTLMVPTGTQENPTVQNINSDGTYTFEFLNDSVEDAAWLIGYQETVAGEKNILIEQIPEQPGFNSAWMFDANNPNVTHTLTSIHLIAAREELEPITLREIPPGESIRLNLQVTGLTDGQEIRVVGANSDEQKPTIISKDGTYKIEYSNTRPDAADIFGIGYKGTIGACDITVSIVGDASKLPAVGDEVVQMGNEKDLMRQALIYISAIGEPKIDALAGINSKSFAGKTKARVGYVGDIVDPDFPADKQPQGYGGYFPNFYGKGTLVLASGETVEGYTNSTILSVVPGEVRQEISKVQIGASNLIPNSSFEEGNPFTTGGWVESFQDYKPVYGSKMLVWEKVNQGDWYTNNTQPVKIKPNTNYVFSIYLIYDGDFTRTSSAIFLASDITFESTTRVIMIPLPAEKKKWERIVVPFTSGADENYFSIRLGAINGSGAGILLADAMQLEEGNVVTAWRESTADVISESTSLIHQVASEVNISVEKKVKAGKIYIKGTGLDRPESRMLIINDDGNNYFIDNRGLALAVIDRATLTVKEVSYYDVYGDIAAQNSLTDKLNSLDYSVFVALASYDAIQFTDALRDALICCGSSGYINQYRCPYAFLGIPGIGLGRGIEISVANTTAPPAEITTSIVNEMFVGSDNAAYEYTKGEVSVTAENIRLQLNDTGIDIANKRITLKAAETHITTADGRSIALFTTDASGNPIIQGSFLKLTDGAEIGGFVVSGKNLYNTDGNASINIGDGFRRTIISSGQYAPNIEAVSNSPSHPAASFSATQPAIALSLHGIMSGLAFKWKDIRSNETIPAGVIYAVAVGTPIHLPNEDLELGQCVFVRNQSSGRITIWGNGNKISYGSSLLDSINLNTKGELFMFVYNGYWLQNHMSY